MRQARVEREAQGRSATNKSKALLNDAVLLGEPWLEKSTPADGGGSCGRRGWGDGSTVRQGSEGVGRKGEGKYRLFQVHVRRVFGVLA
eukprot:6042844-Pleurochrysis_carterae.AAC.1